MNRARLWNSSRHHYICQNTIVIIITPQSSQNQNGLFIANIYPDKQEQEIVEGQEGPQEEDPGPLRPQGLVLYQGMFRSNFIEIFPDTPVCRHESETNPHLLSIGPGAFQHPRVRLPSPET